ncbi:5-oxoprolinase subunit PxpA [Tenacibaculum sp. ZS6-P6]|uniref:5-oxoprolinase subunit PxpA n=1 Tax=Tenacibaculum sp. ZS6-P6 TaxID=3447503 RepID=UPI003F9C1C17
MIDINCDVGEGVNNEDKLMPLISSCNIACNAHAGSIEIIDHVIALAKKYKVKVGAHPSFPDRENFGRKLMDISEEKLQKSIEDQLELLIERSKKQSVKIHHVKPHGALYNIAAKDEYYANIVLNAIEKKLPKAFLYAPYNSVISNLAEERNIKVKFEAFLDRAYNNDLSLVSRNLPGALISNEHKAWEQLQRMIQKEEVISIQEEVVNIKADTFCVHGDNDHAIQMLIYINAMLNEFER